MRTRPCLISFVLFHLSNALPFVAAQVTRELGSMAAPSAPFELGTSPITVRVAMAPNARAQIEAAIAPAKPSETRLLLNFEGITFDQRPEVHYEIYVNLPRNEQPNYKSPYFAGNLTFFGVHHDPQHPANTSFDITALVRTLKVRRSWNHAEVSVTFVPRWLVDRSGRPLPLPQGVKVSFNNVKIAALATGVVQ